MFAIAITLLVLEIQIEPAGFADLWHSLAEAWPSYLAYVTSFLTVGGLYLAAILIGVLLLPRLAAIAYLVVAARAVFLPGGEGGLTLRRHITPAG